MISGDWGDFWGSFFYKRGKILACENSFFDICRTKETIACLIGVINQQKL